MKKRFRIFSVALLTGFLIAIQFQVINHTHPLDTKDTMDLRQSINEEKQTQKKLTAEIKTYEGLLTQYQSENDKQSEETMKNLIQSLKKQAGKTEISGRGIIITLKPLFSDQMAGQNVPVLSEDLLSAFINQLHTFGAKEIAIEDERFITTTPIREVNGKVYINDQPLKSLPVQIKVISSNPENLRNKMLASDIQDYFAVDNVEVKISPIVHIKVPSYKEEFKVNYMQPQVGGTR